MPRAKKSTKSPEAMSYQHPESDSPMRPDMGTQAQFKKQKPPQTYTATIRRCRRRWTGPPIRAVSRQRTARDL